MTHTYDNSGHGNDDGKVNYHIAQNFGEVKLWRISRFRILARKTLANTQIGHGNFGEIQ